MEKDKNWFRVSSSASFLKPFRQFGITSCFLLELNSVSYLLYQFWKKKEKVRCQIRANYSLQPATKQSSPGATCALQHKSSCKPEPWGADQTDTPGKFLELFTPSSREIWVSEQCVMGIILKFTSLHIKLVALQCYNHTNQPKKKSNSYFYCLLAAHIGEVGAAAQL